jgi:toxin-antitoxin system PIN domain toxin
VGVPQDCNKSPLFERPLSTTEAEAAISSWLAQPAAGILDPGERHWDILRGLVRDGQASGPLVMDAVLAAIALEHGATVCTTDRDFSRFPGLKSTNPLAEHR